MSIEMLQDLSREQVKTHLVKIPEKESYTQMLANELSTVVIGQDEAVNRVAGRMILAESRMNDPFRPLSTMMFLGNTGVGKTETAHALAQVMFNDPNSEQLKIIDCAQFQAQHDVAKITGSPPGYVGYGNPNIMFTPDFLGKRNIIVFDEIEKGHPQLHKVLLSIMDKGRITVDIGTSQYNNVKPTVLNFANSHIILTSNVGAKEMQKARTGKSSIGFGSNKTDSNSIQMIGKNALTQRFAHMPEFLGRLDDVVVFNDLESQHYDKIFWKFIAQKNTQIKERMKDEAPYLSATQEAKDFFIASIDKQFGARDLRGLMDREIFQKMAELFVQMDLTGKPIVIDVEDGVSVFYTDDLEPRPPSNVVIFEEEKKNGISPIPKEGLGDGRTDEENTRVTNQDRSTNSYLSNRKKERKKHVSEYWYYEDEE